jgi:hypothetical protein
MLLNFRHKSELCSIRRLHSDGYTYIYTNSVQHSNEHTNFYFDSDCYSHANINSYTHKNINGNAITYFNLDFYTNAYNDTDFNKYDLATTDELNC